jgi:predicted transcriptional regulator
MAPLIKRWLPKHLEHKSKKQNELLGKLLKEARTEAGLSQNSAAAHLGRDQTFIFRLEKGEQHATFVEVEQLARAYAKSLFDFGTLDKIEQSNQNFSVHPDALKEFSDELLKKRRQRRRQKRLSTKRLNQRKV